MDNKEGIVEGTGDELVTTHGSPALFFVHPAGGPIRKEPEFKPIVYDKMYQREDRLVPLSVASSPPPPPPPLRARKKRH